MAFVDLFSVFNQLYHVSSNVWYNCLGEFKDMNLLTTVLRLYKHNKHVVQAVVVTALVIFVAWFFIKGFLVQLARRARLSIEETIATKVDRIASQFDDALQVSYRRATWELVKDNVGVYALQGRRASMEDRFTFVNRLEASSTSLYGVFDGHGGEISADYVEKALFKKLMTKLLDGTIPATDSDGGGGGDSKSRGDYIKQALHSSHMEVDETLLNLLKMAGDGSGTTSIVSILDHGTLYVANVGDSRAVMCDQHLEAIPLSYDHKPDLPDERVRIEKAGGFVAYLGVWRVNGILATSRALGDASLKHNHIVSPVPDIRTFNMAEHKPVFMIMATDGLWDVFSNAEAVRFVHNHITEGDFGAKSLANEAFSRGSLDNISVIIVNFRESSHIQTIQSENAD